MTARTYIADQPGPLALDVELTAGQIRVTVEDRPKALVTITTSQSTAEDASALAEATIAESGGRLTVRLPKTAGMVTTTTRFNGRGGMTVTQVAGTVYGTVVGAVIGNLGGTVIQSGGDLSVSGGQVVIGSAITIDVRLPLGSRLQADTTSADVDTFGELTDVEVATVSGDIRVGTTAQLRARSTSGDIRVDRFTGRQARAKTVSGDIRVHTSEPGSTVQARSVSGDIRVTGSDVDLDARTVSGRVTTR